jgi:hypothetical protein
MIYVASPYSADKKLEVNTRKALEAKRFQDVLKFVYALTKQGYVAFSPIVYYHPLALIGNLPGDAEYWWQINSNYLRFAEALFVLHLPNWDQSKGVQLEMKVAKTLNIPTLHFDKDGAEIKVN